MRQFYDNIIIVKRAKTVAGATIRQALVATATADACIQPVSKDNSQHQEGVFGQQFIAFLDIGISIRKDDRIIDRDGNSYNVSSVIVRDYGSFPYQEALLKRT